MADSFVFYRSFHKALSHLEGEEYKETMELICNYALDGIIPECSGVSAMVFELIKPQIDANIRRRENGKKGGRPKIKNQQLTESKPKDNLDITKSEPNVNVNVNVNEKVNDNVNDNGINNKKEKVKRKKTPTVEESRIGKKQFADEVYLTEDEYMKLVREYGQSGASRMIDILDSYKGANGKTYLSDYKAILNWVVGRYKEEQAKSQRVQPQSLADKWGVRTDDT